MQLLICSIATLFIAVQYSYLFVQCSYYCSWPLNRTIRSFIFGWPSPLFAETILVLLSRYDLIISFGFPLILHGFSFHLGHMYIVQQFVPFQRMCFIQFLNWKMEYLLHFRTTVQIHFRIVCSFIFLF